MRIQGRIPIFFVGLAAAKLLHETGLEVLVLEARDRVGGRTLTEHVSIRTHPKYLSNISNYEVNLVFKHF